MGLRYRPLGNVTCQWSVSESGSPACIQALFRPETFAGLEVIQCRDRFVSIFTSGLSQGWFGGSWSSSATPESPEQHQRCIKRCAKASRAVACRAPGPGCCWRCCWPMSAHEGQSQDESFLQVQGLKHDDEHQPDRDPGIRIRGAGRLQHGCTVVER